MNQTPTGQVPIGDQPEQHGDSWKVNPKIAGMQEKANSLTVSSITESESSATYSQDHLNSKKVCIDELCKIITDCEPHCPVCDKYILQLSRHFRRTHGVLKGGPENESRIIAPGYESDISPRIDSNTVSTRSRLRVKKSVNYAEDVEHVLLKSTSITEGWAPPVATEYAIPSNFSILVDDTKIKCEPEEEEMVDLEQIVTGEPLDIYSTSGRDGEGQDFDDDETTPLPIPTSSMTSTSKDPSKCNFRRKLIRHTKEKHGGEKPYQCEICEQRFKKSGALTIHTRIHTGERPYTCDICKSTFKSMSMVNRHKLIHEEGGGKTVIDCNVCGLKFFSCRQINTHYRDCHPTIKRYVCEICDKYYLKESTLKLHVMSAHTGEKPHVCTECDKGFCTKQRLQEHMKLHRGEKPFTCETCGLRFLRQDKLTIHQRSHTGETPYICETCGKGFRKTHQLTLHNRIHTGEKPYTCEYCKKCFTQKSTLNVHILKHTGEKPHGCSECTQRFTTRKNMNIHMLIHRGEKPHSCEECQRGFRTRAALNKHYKNHVSHKLIVPSVNVS